MAAPSSAPCARFATGAAITWSASAPCKRRPGAPRPPDVDPTEKPMAFDESLAQRLRQLLKRRKNTEEKKMFGGVGFLLKGNMLVGVWKDSLIVRVDPEEGADLLKEPHVRVFDITGRPMKGWLLVDPEGIVDEKPLSEWISRAVTLVASFPAN